MAIDVSTLEGSVRRKRGLMEKLGDAGRFLTALFGSGEVSEAAVRKTIAELERYTNTCFDQMDTMGTEWQKTHRQISELKRKMAKSAPPIRSTMVAQVGILLKRYDGFHGRVKKLECNGTAAQVLVEKLYDLLVLNAGPMAEDDIDDWAGMLDEAIEKRVVIDRAMQELEKTGQRAQLPTQEETSPGQVETHLEHLAERKGTSPEERAIEDRLAEF